MRIRDWSSDVCSSDLPQMAIPDTIERAQEPVAIPLAANALAAGVTEADAVDAPASPIPLAASVSVPAPAADPRPEAKREQKPKPATPSPAKPAAPAGQSLAPASTREAGPGLKERKSTRLDS